jgi:hypothetical protein
VSAAHQIFEHDERTLSEWLVKDDKLTQKCADNLRAALEDIKFDEVAL